MGTEVAVAEQRGMMVIDLKKINYAAAAVAAKKYIQSVGGSSGVRSNFPGTQIEFKSGQWMFGFGDKAKKLKNGTKFIVNVPNVMATWVKWEEYTKDGEEKKRPVFAEVRWPALGHDPVTRESLGDLDQDEWEIDPKSGDAMDPWRPVLVFPARYEDGDELHHIMLSNKSSTIAGYNMYGEVMEELRSRIGELPIIALGADKAEATKKKTVTVKGKQKTRTEKFVWDVPTFEVEEWVEAEEIDNPKFGGVKVTEEGDDTELGDVETKSRKGQKSLPKPSKGKARDEDEDEDDEDDEDEKPAKSKKSKPRDDDEDEDDENDEDEKPAKSKKAKSRRVIEEDEDEDEDDEDEKPAKSKKAKSKGKPRRVVDEDEDEDDDM